MNWLLRLLECEEEKQIFYYGQKRKNLSSNCSSDLRVVLEQFIGLNLIQLYLYPIQLKYT